MGIACALISSFVTHSSFPVFELNARKRRSLVAPMNTSPPAVAMGPPIFSRPVFLLPSGNSSVTPNVTCQANSPVLALTAISRPHGGFWHGHACSPPFTTLPVRGLPSNHWKRDVGPRMLLRSYSTAAPGAFFSIHPKLASSCELTNTYPSFGSAATPPQLTPPIEPGNSTVDRGGAPASRYTYGVNGPSL